MIQIRQSLFETNSSSTHSLTMCTDSDFQKWKDGNLIFDYYDEVLIPVTDEIRKEIDEEGDTEGRYYTYDDFNNGRLEYETFEQEFKTPGGEKVIGFGYFGYD